MSKQKTALDELMDFIEEGKFEFFSDIFDKAKELKTTEEEQIKNAFGNGEYLCFLKDRLDYGEDDVKFHNSDEYYNVTFGNES